jgi:cysteinyl-tRNA synthetase
MADGKLLGLLQSDPAAWLRGETTKIQLDAGASAEPSLTLKVILAESTISSRIEARAAARKARNFAEADRIRKELLDAGVILEDGPKGTTWRRAT